jgi:DNA mismatch endonuclease (patch repair protein)
MPSTEPPKELPGAVRRSVMQRIAKKDTAPELLLRSALHRRGVRYRLQVPVPGLPRRSIDIALTRARMAIFVDGCFWHGCALHFHHPEHNREWWAWKIQSIQHRDENTVDHLTSLGWLAVRVWEHEDMECVAQHLATLRRDRLLPVSSPPRPR